MDKYFIIAGRTIIGILGILFVMAFVTAPFIVIVDLMASFILPISPDVGKIISFMCSSFVGGFAFCSWHKWMFGYDLN